MLASSWGAPTFFGLKSFSSCRDCSANSADFFTISAWKPVWWDEPDIDLDAPVCSKVRLRSGNEAGWPSFSEVVSTSSSDKGTNAAFPRESSDAPHEYAPLYSRHFGRLRNRELNVLEIGIGCNVRVEAASIPLWRRYLPCAKLYVMEMRECVELYKNQLDGMARGDQSKTADLQHAFSLAPFHVIIDDGGHSMLQQITTIREAMHVLPAGGLLVIEDLLTSWISDYQDIPSQLEGQRQTTHRFISNVIEHLHKVAKTPRFLPSTTMEGSEEVAQLTLSVDCIREACIFTRNNVQAHKK
jgi:hypothetical protein